MNNQRLSLEMSNKSKGLGDTIEKIAKITGIKKVVEAVTEDCGCQKRKAMLNKKFPYKQNG